MSQRCLQPSNPNTYVHQSYVNQLDHFNQKQTAPRQLILLSLLQSVYTDAMCVKDKGYQVGGTHYRRAPDLFDMFYLHYCQTAVYTRCITCTSNQYIILVCPSTSNLFLVSTTNTIRNSIIQTA